MLVLEFNGRSQWNILYSVYYFQLWTEVSSYNYVFSEYEVESFYQASKIEYHTDDSDDGHDDEDDYENGGDEGKGNTVVDGNETCRLKVKEMARVTVFWCAPKSKYTWISMPEF